tara:strand:+ start:247 stop:843 length:597 start_codon:yes stop_codon:yes gene_type:complete
MSDKIIAAVSELTKVCEHINLPVQAGDDAVLERMRRPYTQNDYRELVYKIRENIPGVSVSTDMIVGFPGETEAQYQSSLDLITELQFDKIHSAAYSPRPGTISFKTMDDDIPQEEKTRRLKNMDILQEEILTGINHSLVGEKVEVLVEGRKRGKLHGRTRTDKLVFIEESSVSIGSLQDVLIEKTSPWSLQGTTSSAS